MFGNLSQDSNMLRNIIFNKFSPVGEIYLNELEFTQKRFMLNFNLFTKLTWHMTKVNGAMHIVVITSY